MASLGKLEALIPITAVQTMRVTETTPDTAAANHTIAIADYYLTSTTSLLTAVKTALDAVSGNSTYTVTLDDTNDSSTGKVTISATGIVSFAIEWTSTTLRDILGFTGDVTGAATYTGSNQALYLHLPNCGRTDVGHPAGDVGSPIRDGNIVFAPGSSVTYAMSFATRYRSRLAFSHLLGNKAWTSLETVTNEAFQTFWTYSIAKGYPIRWHKDRNDDADYEPWRVLRVNELGLEAVNPNWVGTNSLWRYSSDVVKYE